MAMTSAQGVAGAVKAKGWVKVKGQTRFGKPGPKEKTSDVLESLLEEEKR
jgi:hypothetical protein